MAKWTDSTSYSRGERGTVAPRAWDLDLAGLRIAIHRIHGIDDVWFGTCHTMNVKDRELGSDLEKAKPAFLRYLKQRAWSWADKIADAEVK